MFFKRFRRFVRAKARKQYAERERQRQKEREWAALEIEYQQRMERERADGAYIALENVFIWSRVHATAEQIIAVRNNLLALGWTPPREVAVETERKVFFDASDCFEEGMTVALKPDGSAAFNVSEEKAVDSYNRTFNCTYTMKAEDIPRLCALLNGAHA